MNNVEFNALIIDKTIEYFKKQGIELSESDIFVSWMVKNLQNNKAVVGVPQNGMYLEFSYNGDKNQLYVDVYDKRENVSVQL
ncbi:hypothetical protein WOSG25_390020 [Weissella oryzae SG25]|uniref:Uncharacterized protein n=1 Tax=Weissella oryzae (strain DSM 25784 / JCM 18191 / LMG 30913 / SG25) TaxID=1329250 RepID=A0A069D3V5_WEIOS|nr:DUF6275 family protein [Weissella oryzae]GAK32106.1 hypothetical protein WOSG25_390020 [Weissella oryzae SG25]